MFMIINFFNHTTNLLQPVTGLIIRIWVAQVFFIAGLTKIQSWDSTLFLFEYEYKVPFISPKIAAILGTAGELILPIFLIFGFLTRLSALGLFILNIVAVIAYFHFLAKSPDAMIDHIIWGMMLLVPLAYGASAFSLDHLWDNIIIRSLIFVFYAGAVTAAYYYLFKDFIAQAQFKDIKLYLEYGYWLLLTLFPFGILAAIKH